MLTLIKRLRDEHPDVFSATWLMRVRKGDSFRIAGRRYTATRITLASEDYKNTTIDKTYPRSLYICGVMRKGTSGGNSGFFRDAEGDLMVDLINEFNPLHESSDLFRIYH